MGPGSTDRSSPNGCGGRGWPRTQRSRAVAWCGGAGRSDHAATRATPPPLAVGEPLESPRLPFRSTRAARRGEASALADQLMFVQLPEARELQLRLLMQSLAVDMARR